MSDLTTDTWNGLKVLKVKNEAAEAVIALNGVHVLSYIPAGERDLLWVSKETYHESGKPIRGGIPVCWPWFGKANMPQHGVARITEWTLKETVSETRKTILRFEPFEYENLVAEMTITVADSLTLELTTTNNSSAEYRLTDALHSYFPVSDIAKIAILGLDKAEYLDTLNGQRNIQEEEEVRFTAETDRIYDSSDAECVIDDPAYTKKIHIAKEGSLSTVVWNPWAEKSKNMPDFGDAEFHGMVCVETTNAGNDFRMLKPGEKHTLKTLISLK